MEKLDFLSGAPKLFVFEKRAKENVFGGFLTIIYLIVVFLIATLYIYMIIQQIQNIRLFSLMN